MAHSWNPPHSGFDSNPNDRELPFPTGSEHTITISGASDLDYTITYVSGTLTVTPAPLTITADNKTKVYGDPLPTLTATYTGFVNGDTETGLTVLPTLTTTATAASHIAGNPYGITADGAVSADYTISYLSGTLTVTPAPLTITADDKTKEQGEPIPPLTASYVGFVNGDSISSLTTQPTITTSATADSPPADYPITVSGAVDPDYTISYVNGMLHVLPSSINTTIVSIVSSVNPSVFGQPLTFTTMVVPSSGTGLPTGSVVFSEGSVVLGTIALVQGSASFTTSVLTRGNHAIVASYSGDASFQAGTSSPLTQVVQTVAMETDPVDSSKYTLAIGGTGKNDAIQATYNSRKNRVTVVVSGGTAYRGTFDAAQLAHLALFGGAGNDVLRVASTLRTPALLFGGDGNDVLWAGAGASALVGGGGNDVLYGGKGRSLLIGGLGNDTLVGGKADDIMIGGTTDHDANVLAIDRLLAEWSRDDADHTTRINHLLGPSAGGSSGGLNSPYFLNPTTVHDDSVVDSLFGGNGMDWFFAASGRRGDRISGRKPHEVVTML